jgi:hypothetical protein
VGECPIGAILSTSRDQLLSRLQALAASAWLCVGTEIVWEVCTHDATRRKFREIAERLLGETERAFGETKAAGSETKAKEAERSGGLF